MLRTGRGLGRVCAAALPLVLVAAACGDDNDDAADDATGTTERESADEAPETLRIHVTNDDGIESPGIDTVVEALKTLDDVEVMIIAPHTDWSGGGDGKCEDLPEEEQERCDFGDDGELEASDAETLSGEPGTAVHGKPADSVVWAHENVFAEDQPHVTVSGNNGGPNTGPFVYLSGTIGAARESARHEVPALAVSQGFGEVVGNYDEADYEAAVPFLLDWIEEHREALLAGEVGLETVDSLNVPTCWQGGEVRGLVETSRATPGEGEGGSDVLAAPDCASSEDSEGLQDVEAFLAGFATLSPIDVEEPPAAAEE